MGTIYRNGTPFVGSGGAGGFELTQAEYDALPTSEKMNGTIYFISDGEASYPSASTMRYDNSTSGLTATSVQAAVDEVNGKVNDNAGDIAELNNGLNGLVKVGTATVDTNSTGSSTSSFLSEQQGVLISVADNTNGVGGGFTVLPVKYLGFYKCIVLDGITPWANKQNFPIKYWYI